MICPPMNKVGIAIFLPLLMIASQAGAQQRAAVNAAEADEGPICLAIAHLWSGSLDDVRNINTIPVPDSFRRPFSAGGCDTWQLVKQGLINWHLSFGTEASTAKALTFIEDEYRKQGAALPNISVALERAWKAAMPDMDKAHELLTLPKPNWEHANEILAKSRPFKRLSSLTEEIGREQFIVEEYIRAAEFFGSRSFHERARLHYAFVEERDRFFEGKVSVDLKRLNSVIGRRLIGFYSGPIYVADLRMRMALMKARLSRNADDVAAASLAIERDSNDAMKQAAEFASENFEDFGSNRNNDDYPQLASALDTDGNFMRRATNYWRNKAQLEQLKQQIASTIERGGEDHNFAYYNAMSMLEWTKTQGRNRQAARGYDSNTFPSNPADAIIALHLATVDKLMAQSTAQETVTTSKSNENEQNVFRLRQLALAELSQASLLAPPHETPGRFRQIASRYLSVYELLKDEVTPQDQRLASYFTHTLISLDQIALGKVVKAGAITK
jgi:hypothetical protein